MIREDVVARLVATGKWSESTARLAEHAGYKCEYCGFDLLGSVEAYKLFEVDHIVPQSLSGDAIEFNNLALSCRHCNFHLKRSWDPRSVAGHYASREQLVLAVKVHIDDLRHIRHQDLEEVRGIVGWTQAGQVVQRDRTQ